VHSDDLGPVDVDLAEDLAQGLLAQLIWDRGTAPERARLAQNLPRAPQPELVGRHRGARHRPVQLTPRAAERLDADRPRSEPRLELLARLRLRRGIHLSRDRLGAAHRPEHLAHVVLRQPDAVEQPRDLVLVALRAVGGGAAAGGAPGVPDAPPAVGRVPVVATAAADTAHEAHERIGPPLLGEARVPGPPVGPDGLHPVEQPRIDRGAEPRGLLLLVGPALVANRAAGVERVGQDLGEPGLGEPELVRERHVAPGAAAYRVNARRTRSRSGPSTGSSSRRSPVRAKPSGGWPPGSAKIRHFCS
jgi:hypothetical protein